MWTLLEPETSPLPRSAHSMAFDERRGVTVMHGGATEAAVSLNDVWEFDGAEWTNITPDDSPAPDERSSKMVYDSDREVIVLLTSVDEAFQTWEYDGVEWIETSPDSSPSYRYGVSISYDPRIRRVIINGGRERAGSPVLGGYLAETWAYDGTDWEDLDIAGPPYRNSHFMAYDSSRGVTVLFGGYRWSGRDDARDDTWEFDGAAWTEAEPTSPGPARLNHILAYDSVRERTVVFGGHNSSGHRRDTWEYDGVTWYETTPDPSPPQTNGAASAYDPIRRQIMMFGGNPENTGTGHTDQTWVYRYESDWPDEDCESGADDDDDGLTDCEDPDCALLPVCSEAAPCDDIECLTTVCRYEGNPVLENASAPYVLFEDGEFTMWFRRENEIWRAVSDDGVNWEESPETPVLARGVGWDSYSLLYPVVFRSDGLYRMYYNGQQHASAAGMDIGYATSDDGIVWERFAENPVITEHDFGTRTWSIIGLAGQLHDDGVHLFIRKAGVMCDGETIYLHSDDWTGFRASGTTNLTGPAGDGWDRHSIVVEGLFERASGFGAYYSGASMCSGADSQIGLLTSDDGLTWTRASEDPVLQPGDEGSWESDYVRTSNVVEVEGERWLYYGGVGESEYSIGLAFIGDACDE